LFSWLAAFIVRASLPPHPPFVLALPAPPGIIATDVSIAAGVLLATEFGGSQATAASVRRLELEFPSLSRPLLLRLVGVRLAVQQVRLPQVSCVHKGVGRRMDGQVDSDSGWLAGRPAGK